MNGIVMYIVFLAPAMILGLIAQHRVKSTFRKFSEVPSSSKLTGAEVARMILDRNGLTSVPVEAVPGELSDHYDPRTRTVRLSEPVFGARSISAVSVAAHEVGHAIQHAQAYAPMTVRSAIVPVASFGSNFFFIILMAGVFMQSLGLIQLAIAIFAATVLFQVVTLPVEFNASSRAKVQLNQLGIIPSNEAAGTAKVLNAAAMTYVAAALAALSQLLYFVLAYLGDD
jgi:Zn-dependent membrane protease YugP